MEKGYIKLSRKFFENKIWQAARAFNEGEAWLDLIQLARFETSEITSRIGVHEITWGRGQYPASNRFLMRKWGRSEQWVKTFLSKLKKEKMITVDSSQGVNVITLLNYDAYNSTGNTKNSANNSQNNSPNTLIDTELQAFIAQQVAQQVTQWSLTSNSNNKKEKKDKKEINIPPVIPPTGDDVLEDDELSSSFPVSGNATSVPHAMSKPSSKNHTGDDELEKLFDEFRKAYPTQKRGLQTEFANFKKKHKDWKEVLPLLLPAIQAEIAWHEEKRRKREFCPQYKNFQTWINQRCWEQEFVLEDPPVSSSPVKPKDGELNDKGQVWSEQLNRWLN